MKTMLSAMSVLMVCVAGFFRGLRLAGNENETPCLANAADGGSPFAILQDNSFVVPYGEFPHKQGLQVFTRAEAEEMVANHKGLLTRLVSWARGEKASYPVYVGHPDLPGSKDTDKRAYGWIENMRAEDDGLHLEVKWSDEGRKLVENAHFKFYSPLWWTKKGKVRGTVRPVSLKSMGLTNDPNIPVPALANEMSEEDPEKPEGDDQERPEQVETTEQVETPEAEAAAVVVMPELLAALGLGEEATLEEVLAEIESLKGAVRAAQDEATAKAGEVKTATEATAAANARVAVLEGSLRIAANDAVGRAMAAGRVTPAEADAKVEEVLAANDFAGALQGLGKLPAKVKVTSATGDLGGAKCRLVVAANDDAKARREERAQLVENEYQNTNPKLSTGERRRIAWRKAQAKNPELFATKGSSGSEA